MKSAILENKLLLVLTLVLPKLITEIFSREFELGPCFLQFLEPCANNSIQFFLFTSDRPRNPPVLLDNISPTLRLNSNDTERKNFKMIIHGYGGHLDFNGSKQIRNGKAQSMLKSILDSIAAAKPAFCCETKRDTHSLKE